jgi:hypothetical protein
MPLSSLVGTSDESCDLGSCSQAATAHVRQMAPYASDSIVMQSVKSDHTPIGWMVYECGFYCHRPTAQGRGYLK